MWLKTITSSLVSRFEGLQGVDFFIVLFDYMVGMGLRGESIDLGKVREELPIVTRMLEPFRQFRLVKEKTSICLQVNPQFSFDAITTLSVPRSLQFAEVLKDHLLEHRPRPLPEGHARMDEDNVS